MRLQVLRRELQGCLFHSVCAVCFLAISQFGFAQSNNEIAKSQGNQLAVETVVTGLSQPTGLVLAPGSTEKEYKFFIAEQAAGRVVVWKSSSPDDTTVAISGFNGDGFDSSPAAAIGLQFVGYRRLLVCGDVSANSGFAFLFAMLEDGKELTAINPKQRVDRKESGDPQYGRYCDMVSSSNSVFMATASMVGRVFRADTRSASISDFKPLIELGAVTSPVALALNPSPDKGYLAVVKNVAEGVSGESVLSIHDPVNGGELLNTLSGMQHVVALAYSPKTGRLYAAGNADGLSGVYRLDANYESNHWNCEAIPLTHCERPSCMAFAPDGSLFVAVLDKGEQETGSRGSVGGSVIRLQGNL